MRRSSIAPRSLGRGRGLLVLAVAALCLVPAANAAASGHEGGAVRPAGSSDREGGARTSRPQATGTARPGRTERTAAPTRRVGTEPAHSPSTSATSTSRTAAPSRPAPPTGAAKPDSGAWWPWGRALHGQLTLPTDGGTVQTLVLQQGSITALTAGTLTVTSTDGFVAEWTLDEHSSVVGIRKPERRAAAEPSENSTATATATQSPAATDGLAVGQLVGVWATGTPDAGTARFVVVHRPAAASR